MSSSGTTNQGNGRGAVAGGSGGVRHANTSGPGSNHSGNTNSNSNHQHGGRRGGYGRGVGGGGGGGGRGGGSNRSMNDELGGTAGGRGGGGGSSAGAGRHYGGPKKRAPQRGAGSKHGVTKNQSNDAPSKPASESEAASVAESRPPGLTNHPKNVQASAAPGTYAAILSQNTPAAQTPTIVTNEQPPPTSQSSEISTASAESIVFGSFTQNASIDQSSSPGIGGMAESSAISKPSTATPVTSEPPRSTAPVNTHPQYGYPPHIRSVQPGVSQHQAQPQPLPQPQPQPQQQQQMQPPLPKEHKPRQSPVQTSGQRYNPQNPQMANSLAYSARPPATADPNAPNYPYPQPYPTPPMRTPMMSNMRNPHTMPGMYYSGIPPNYPYTIGPSQPGAGFQQQAPPMGTINTLVQPQLNLPQQDQPTPVHVPQRSNPTKNVLRIVDPVSHEDVPVTPREERAKKSALLKSSNANTGIKALPKDGRVGTEKQVLSIKRPENLEGADASGSNAQESASAKIDKSHDEKASTTQSASLVKDTNSHAVPSQSEENGQLKGQAEEEVVDSAPKMAEEPAVPLKTAPTDGEHSSKTSETPSGNQPLEGTAEKAVSNGKGEGEGEGGGALKTNGSDTTQKGPSAEREEGVQAQSKAGSAGEKDALSTSADQGGPGSSEDKGGRPEKANGESHDSQPQLKEEPKAESKSSEESRVPSVRKGKLKDRRKAMNEQDSQGDMLDAFTPSIAKQDIKEKEPVVEPKKVEKQEVEEEKKEEDEALDNWEDSEVAGNDNEEESAEVSHIGKTDGKYKYTHAQITALQSKAATFPEDLFSVKIISRNAGKMALEKFTAQESGAFGSQHMAGGGRGPSRQMSGLSRSDSGNLQERWPRGEVYGNDQPRSPRARDRERETGRLSRQSSLRDRENWMSGNKDVREVRVTRQDSRTGIDGDTWERKPRPPPEQQRRGRDGRNFGPGSGMPPLPMRHGSAAPYLHKSEKRWQRDAKTDEETVKLKTVKGILNKLTPENFERLSKQIIEVNINTSETLVGIIDLIFEKALLEPTFCEVYAYLCVVIKNELPAFEDKKISFRRVLLTKCQTEFEKNSVKSPSNDTATEEPQEEDLDEKEKEYRELISRKKMLGNITFVGELYKTGVLPEKIMHQCVWSLLANSDEDSLECLCNLLRTCGAKMDNENGKKTMDTYFAQIKALTQPDSSLSSRVRFMLMNLVELRGNKWHERIMQQKLGPKKIDDVHKDAEAEAHQKMIDTRAIERGRSFRSDRDRGRDRFGGDRRHPVQIIERDGPVDKPYLGKGEAPKGPMKSYKGGEGMRLGPPERAGLGSLGSSRMSTRIQGPRRPDQDILLEKKPSAISDESKKRANDDKPASSSEKSVATEKDKEQAKKIMGDMLEELLTTGIHAEVSQSLRKIFKFPGIGRVFFGLLLDHFVNLEKDQRGDKGGATLLGIMEAAIQDGFIKAKDVQESFEKLVSDWASFVMDSPFAGPIIAEILTGLMDVKDKGGNVVWDVDMLLGVLRNPDYEMIEPGDASRAIATILRAMPLAKAQALLSENKINLQEFARDKIGKEISVDQFVKDEGLQHLLPISYLTDSLKKALDICKSTEDLTKWLSDRSNISEKQLKDPRLAKLLVKQILKLKYTDKESWFDSAIKEYSDVFQQVLGNNPKMKVAVLYGIQELAAEEKFPHNVTKALFDSLYQLDIVEKAQFVAWKDDVKDDTPGKEKALIATNSWFLQLFADEEEEDANSQ